MPSQNPRYAPRGQKKINPATVSIDELLDCLVVDPAVGLSPKEASRRADKGGVTPLFSSPRPPFSFFLKKTVKEPALWLLLAVGVVALFFDRELLGVFCLLLGGGNACLSAFILRRAANTDAAMQSYDVPLSRVRRGGRVRRVPADRLARGDVLILRKGDIVPADCRLLFSEDLVIAEREMDATNPSAPAVHLTKDPTAAPETRGGFRHSPVNMVFAGGIVEKGRGTAVVVAVGSATHMGGFSGKIPPAHPSRNPAAFAEASRYLSLNNLAMLLLILPLTAIGIFTLGDRYELLDIYLTALALAVASLGSHLLARGTFIASTLRRNAAAERVNAAHIKNDRALESLSSVNDLLLVGSAALHDGGSHPDTLHVGDRSYHCNVDFSESDEASTAVVELMCIYDRYALVNNEETTPDGVPVKSLAHALAEWAEPDLNGVFVRVKDIRRETDGVSGIFPTVEGNRRMGITVTASFEAATACELIHRGSHEAPMTEADRMTLYRKQREAFRTGRRICYVIARAGGQHILRAMIAYVPRTCRKTAGIIKSMEAAGIRVTAFLRDVTDENTRVLTECGLTHWVASNRPTEEERPPASELVAKGVRAFEGCDEAYVTDYISALKAQGRTVAVLTADGRDLPLLRKVDVVFTCAPAPEDVIPTPCEDGLPDGPCADDLLRRRANVIVRRATTAGEGLMGVRRAILAADHYRQTLDHLAAYLFVSQLARILTVLLPLVFGLSLTTAPVLLLSGVILDYWVMKCYTATPLPVVPLSKRRPAEPPRPWVTHRPMLVAAVIAVTVSWLAVGIARTLAIDLGVDPSLYAFLCLFGLQIALFRSAPLPRRSRHVFFATLGMLFLYVAAVGVALAAGLGLYWALLIPLLSPLVYVIVRMPLLLLRALRGHR